MFNSIRKRLRAITSGSENGDTPANPGRIKRYWQATKKLPWGRWLRFSWVAPGLERLTSIVLKLGTLMLVGFFLVFFVRLFKDQGYVIQAVSVPKQLEEQGFNGQVVALRIQNQVDELKELAGSVKADSLELKGDQQDLDLSVLGVGLSLRSLAFQLREVLGRENKTVGGEITRIGDQYQAQIRMTGFDHINVEVVVEDGSEVVALNQLFRLIAEGVLFETDPYRLALVQRKEDRHDEAVATIRHYLQDREDEAHWAYLCWGALLRDLGKNEEAAAKFERAIAVKPDFPLAHINVAWTYNDLDRPDDAIMAFKKVIELEPDDVWRRNNLAWTYYNNDMPQLADSLYEHSLATMDLDPDTRADFAISWAEMKIQDDNVPAAKEIIDTYVESYSENVFSYLVKGISALAEQDTLQALSLFSNAFEIDPSNVGAVQSNIAFNILVGNYETAIDFYHAAEWDYFSMFNEIHARNQASMAFNFLEQHDSAFVNVKRAIAINPELAYPYTTLAETFYFVGQKDSCFHYLEKALSLGFDPDDFSLDMMPYPNLVETIEFQQLIERYRNEEQELVD